MEAYEDFAHIGPGTVAGKFMRRFWQPVLVGDELVIGRPKRIQVLNEFFTAYRGEDMNIPGFSVGKYTGYHFEISSTGTSTRGATSQHTQGAYVIQSSGGTNTFGP